MSGCIVPLDACPARTEKKAAIPDQRTHCRQSHSETLLRERPFPGSPLQTAETPMKNDLHIGVVTITVHVSQQYRNIKLLFFVV